MYLKSIEIHGFKSFANKILFEFHDGITGIVGPNGSGKSNVADAVRWVLGEQSAKQLRGSNMQDVIFSGSEARKPLGFAYVEITFDNSDHKLAIAYDEVSVARRVYRSGESEYLLNGMTCRLKDVQELFMDTGIGKEGYSIIGQGQIERILSTKPEERRELFDEAAGIVKFKKRKAIAEKNLEDAQANLARINDIILELEKQVGPLEMQSQTAMEFLRLRDILKDLELNSFICEYEKSDSARNLLDEKIRIASDDLAQTKAANENAEAEYKRLENSIEDYNKALEDGRNYRSELLIAIEKLEGEIKVFEQQMIAIVQNNERIEERTAAVEEDIKAKEAEKKAFNAQKEEFDERGRNVHDKVEAASQNLNLLKDEQDRLSKQIESDNEHILKFLNDDGTIKTTIQKYDTMLEQINIRKSDIAKRLLINKSELSDAQEIAADLEKQDNEIKLQIKDADALNRKLYDELLEVSQKEKKLNDIYDGVQQNCIGTKSRLESLKNIAERYEGYGNTVRKIMEERNRFKGICGVVADLISTEKKYEIAVETALGASVSHIVTEDEQDARDVIEFLKKNKLGRATFLPITSVGRRKNDNPEEVFKEKGVISEASKLVSADAKYSGIIEHLLKSFIVVDNVDNALAIARKYQYSLRIVTLEGEQLAPGGSIAGGAYKNSGNLLSRNREIKELEEKVEQLSGELAGIRKQLDANAVEKKNIRERMDEERLKLQKLYVDENTARLKLEKELENLKELNERSRNDAEESSNLDTKAKDLRNEITKLNNSLDADARESERLKGEIDEIGLKLVQLKKDEEKALQDVSELRLEEANIAQAGHYAIENIERINADISKLNEQKVQILDNSRNSKHEIEEKQQEIDDNRSKIEQNRKKTQDIDKDISELIEKKDNITKEHKSFFDSWSELGKHVTELEKEVLRLSNQREKLVEQLDSQTNYIWEEYKLTFASALNFRNPDFKPSSARKDINETKSLIKNLGNVNVNAIDEYKEVSKRYELLSSQRDDLMQSRESIQAIIDELDQDMRVRFAEQFKLIREQFNAVFRELFGGGKGELELIEDEDILEAGIRIIAQPPGKKLQNMMQLSGGEKSLTAIALLFAIQNLKPSPFCLLDEIEAALDDSNVKRFSHYLHKLTKNSQFIVITHRRGTMAAADILYGITMQEKGVSTLVSVNLIEGDLDS